MKRPINLAGLALLLGAIACTCGPLTQITQVAEDAQQLAEDAQEIAPTAAAAATLAAELEESGVLEDLEQFEELPGGDIVEEQPVDPNPPAESADGASLVGACALVTPDEVAAEFGRPLASDLAPTEVEEQATCTFSFEDGTAFVLTIQDNNTPETASQNFSVIALAFEANEAVAGPGLDQAAYSAEAFTLFATSGRYLFTAGGSVADDRDAMLAVTGLYGSRLP